MAIELSQFHEAFFEEGFESLDAMEAALLQLDIGAPNPETVNTVFRVAHSIKGGSGMFGFTDIMSFTHTLETLLDELRGGRMQVTSRSVDLLLKSVDVLREMMTCTQKKEPIDQQRVADLQFDLELVVAQKGTGAAASAAPAAAGTSTPGPADPATASSSPRTLAPGMRAWRIDFKPLPELLARGNDPLRMFAELRELGEVEACVDLGALPAFRDIDPEYCYLTWRIDLHSEVSREVIAQVFEWAEGDCELSICELSVPAAEAAPAAPVKSVALVDDAPAATDSSVADAPVSRADAAPAGPQLVRSEAADIPKSADASSIRVSIEKIDELMNTVGEIVITQSMLTQLGARLEGGLADRMRSGLSQLERNVRELQESVMRVRMLPISFVFSRFPRLVRDLSQRLGKQIELKMTGQETELDKTVLEKIGDPLVHLVRNSIDHGIEKPEARLAAGKPAGGTVCMDAYHKGGSITVEVSDDGGGLDRDRILDKARSRGLIGASDVLPDDAIHELIFLPGFSTAEQTTDVSGRGVGMDVVRRNIKELGGAIEVRSELGKGSRFIITLPLTLAIVDGQTVAVGSERYIVPLVAIVESLQIKPQAANRVVGRGEVFSFRGDYVPVVRLHELFNVKPKTTQLHEGLVMVVEGDGRRVGLFVDDLEGQQQVVIKSMETNYGRVEGVSGATITGEGTVALILDVPGLIRVAGQQLAA